MQQNLVNKLSSKLKNKFCIYIKIFHHLKYLERIKQLNKIKKKAMLS